jgi:hypothetical protein
MSKLSFINNRNVLYQSPSCHRMAKLTIGQFKDSNIFWHWDN